LRFFLPMLIVTLAAHLDGQVGGNQAGSKADWACVEEMRVPLYDGLIWVARASGQLHASIAIGPDAAGTLIEIHSESPRGLVETLKTALHDARFSSRCAGQTLEVTFIYRFEGAPNANPHNEVRFKTGNTFEIVARPPLPIPPQP